MLRAIDGDHAIAHGEDRSRALARRFLAAFLGAALGVGFAAVIAAPAQAQWSSNFGSTGWAYTDSRLPDQSFINPSGDAPVGAWNDAQGRKHKITYDISPLTFPA